MIKLNSTCAWPWCICICASELTKKRNWPLFQKKKTYSNERALPRGQLTVDREHGNTLVEYKALDLVQANLSSRYRIRTNIRFYHLFIEELPVERSVTKFAPIM